MGFGLTPNQLFTAGCLWLRNSGLAALDFFYYVAEDYGTEDGIANPDSGVEIPPNEVQLTEEQQFSELQQTVNPQSDCEDMGIDLYLQTLQFVQSVL